MRDQAFSGDSAISPRRFSSFALFAVTISLDTTDPNQDALLDHSNLPLPSDLRWH